jgi:hypothetical protein
MDITIVTRIAPDSPSNPMLRLRDVRLGEQSHAERALGASLGFSNDVADVFASFITERPIVVPVNSKGGVVGGGWYVEEDATFDARTYVHPDEEGWTPADPTASPYVVIAMRQHCEDCAVPALRTVPWVEVGGQRFSDLVSVYVRRGNDLGHLGTGIVAATNGSGHLVVGCEWVADIELIGSAFVEFE